ncbi:MAG: PD-(D/E)XK nuclease family protein [Lachnospiraceae bacterium]|jgi:hypothetical protein|nr:PD-(D/E)XK nuclease family protein [Lachnospiraceae bacterium]
MDLAQIIKKANESIELKNINEYYSRKTLLSMSPRISRLEEVHTAFLYWLLCKIDTVDFSPLKFLLNFLIKEKKVTNLEFDNITNIEISETEHPLGDNYGRLDLYFKLYVTKNGVKKEINIIIENKVKSKENDSQTNKYVEWALSYAKLNNPLFLYVTPNNGDKPENARFIVITYQNIVDYIIEPLIVKNIDDSYIVNMLSDYLRTISFQEYYKGDLVMATNSHEIYLINDFYEKYNELFDIVMLCISGIKKLNNEEYNLIKEFYYQNEKTIDRIAFIINEKNSNTTIRVPLDTIKDTYKETREVFNSADTYKNRDKLLNNNVKLSRISNDVMIAIQNHANNIKLNGMTLEKLDIIEGTRLYFVYNAIVYEDIYCMVVNKEDNEVEYLGDISTIYKTAQRIRRKYKNFSTLGRNGFESWSYDKKVTLSGENIKKILNSSNLILEDAVVFEDTREVGYWAYPEFVAENPNGFNTEKELFEAYADYILKNYRKIVDNKGSKVPNWATKVGLVKMNLARELGYNAFFTFRKMYSKTKFANSEELFKAYTKHMIEFQDEIMKNIE